MIKSENRFYKEPGMSSSNYYPLWTVICAIILLQGFATALSIELYRNISKNGFEGAHWIGGSAIFCVYILCGVIVGEAIKHKGKIPTDEADNGNKGG